MVADFALDREFARMAKRRGDRLALYVLSPYIRQTLSLSASGKAKEYANELAKVPAELDASGPL